MSMIKEFKEFAIKGNMIDMAVGIVIGGASSKVVSSLVEDIIMPPLGYLIGKVNLTDFEAVIIEEQRDANGAILQPEIVISYGGFLQVTLDFILMAAVLFLVVKLFNMLRRMAEDEKDTKVPTPRNIELLANISDTLKRMDDKMQGS